MAVGVVAAQEQAGMIGRDTTVVFVGQDVKKGLGVVLGVGTRQNVLIGVIADADNHRVGVFGTERRAKAQDQHRSKDRLEMWPNHVHWSFLTKWPMSPSYPSGEMRCS